MTVRAQPFAALILADAKLERIRAATSNIAKIAGAEADAVIGADVADVIGGHAVHRCRNALGYPLIETVAEIIPFTGVDQRKLTAAAHVFASHTVIEVSAAFDDTRAMNLLNRFAAGLPLAADPLTEAADVARMISGCDHVAAFHLDAASRGAPSLAGSSPFAALTTREARTLAVLNDVEAPCVDIVGSAADLASPLALSLSHEPELSDFARAINARGALFARSGPLAIVGWSETAMQTALEALRVIELVARIASIWLRAPKPSPASIR